MSKISKYMLVSGSFLKPGLIPPNKNPLTIKTYGTTSLKRQTFLNGQNARYLEQLYEEWLSNPREVHQSLDVYFRNLNKAEGSNYESEEDLKTIETYLALQMIIDGYQSRGYLFAQTNPLSYDSSSQMPDNFQKVCPHLRLDNLPQEAILKLPPSAFVGGNEHRLMLKETITRLERAYCGHIGVQYMHIEDPDQRMWIRKKFESPETLLITKEEKLLMLKRLGEATWLEEFLGKRFPTVKLFGIEGCEIVIPSLNVVIDKSSELGVDTIIIGGTHRGRVNILTNVCQTPLELIIALFMDNPVKGWHSGDVKYHWGAYTEKTSDVSNKKIRISLLGNPSHLELIYPVVLGRAKSEQFLKSDLDGRKVLPIVLHGDAALCGQGVCYETLNLSNLPPYTTHGTIHVVINNKIGFTTEPHQYKSCTETADICTIVGAPIFHVNSDDPDCVLHASKIAAEWRSVFRKDVVLNVVGYRRFGHSEEDDPSYTQPILYSKIKNRKKNFDLYAEKMIEQDIIRKEEVADLKRRFDERFNKAFDEAKRKKSYLSVFDWSNNPKFMDSNATKVNQTGINDEVMDHIALKFASPPPASHNFQMHKGMARILSTRMKMVKEKVCNWAIAEALAIGSLLKEGIHVRLTGQDVERGAFAHRHHVLFHQSHKNVTYQYLTDLYPEQSPYTISNSTLSECGSLAFELGYSTTNANVLVIWEAQYGDFFNNAQSIFDAMISSGESKWGRQTGLVCYLPHGMEGPGPEHSSARPERFLQMTNDDPDYLPPDSLHFANEQLKLCNWCLVNCTTPANLFHVLRRQMALPFRKPLIMLTPKSLLRHPAVRSPFKDLKIGTEFQRVITNQSSVTQNPEKVTNILFCTGKVYYDIVDSLKKNKCEDKLPIIRIEQISPFPYDLVKKECRKYPNAQIVWVQEEHKNAGCWSYVQPRFETATCGQRDITYIGRPPSASTATGFHSKFLEELAKFLEGVTKLCEYCSSG